LNSTAKSNILYVIATPIGNLGDMTYRGVEILNSVDIIACEDTRITVRLLVHYNITGKKLVSYYQENSLRRAPEIVEYLKSGKSVALVSDGGTPGISDPGGVLIKMAVENGIKVVPLPGASAGVTLLSVTGIELDGYVFLGFLSKKPGKLRKELRTAAELGKVIVFYESPYRIIRAIESIVTVLGPQAKVIVGRELTKMFEEIIRGTAEDVVKYLQSHIIKGEFVVVVELNKKMEVST